MINIHPFNTVGAFTILVVRRFGSVCIGCLLAGLLFLPSLSHADRTINSATLNGAASVVVAPNAAITAVVNVTTDGSGPASQWKSLAWRIATTPPGALTCVDHSNHNGAGNYSETLSITAPAAMGTYNVYFYAYQDNACGGASSNLYVMSNAVFVGQPPVAAKSFAPSSIVAGATSVLTVTLANANTQAITGAAFTDNYPSNLRNTATPGLTNSCGGTATAAANGTSLALSGGTIPAGGTCSLTAQVTSTVSGSYVNSTGLVTTTNAGSGAAATATLTVGSVAPGSFNAFETSTTAGAINGVIKTKIAGSPFSLAVVAISGGAQASGFTNTVKVELLGNVTTGVSLDGNNCPTSFTLLQTVTPNPTLAGGRSNVNFSAVSDVWRDVRVRVSYPVASPTVISCSTDNFAIRPASLSVAATDTNWQTPGTTRILSSVAASSGPVHKAGQLFTLRATGRDASGTVTSNYTGQPTLKTLTCMLPTPTCTDGVLTIGAWSGLGGTVASTTASYSEAGAFNLTLEDQTFANVDSSDSTLPERTIPQAAALAVGRFVPDHFEVMPNISAPPSFRTWDFNDATCTARAFTYIGQSFGYAVRPTATILAKGQGNNTLANYKGSLWKIGGVTAPVVVKDCTTDPNACVFTTNWSTAGGSSEVIETYTYTLTPASIPNWDDAGSTPQAASVNPGTGLISFAASDTLAFKRSNIAPQAPFTASITNTITVKDLSEAGNCGLANCDITTSTPAQFGNISFDVTPTGNEFRFGRLALSNAHGSELLGLPVPIETQYWNGSAFTRNAADNCTLLAPNQVALSNWQPNLNACETSVALAGRFNLGRGNLRLSAPGTSAGVPNTGSVDLTLNLDAVGAGTTCVGGAVTPVVGASQIWLRGGPAYNKDPVARASFGLFRGSKPLIYMRELY